MKKCPFSTIKATISDSHDTRAILHKLATGIISNIWSVLSNQSMKYRHIPKENFYKNFNLQTIEHINKVRGESIKVLNTQGQKNIINYSTLMGQVLGEEGLMLPSFTDLITFMSAFAQGLESLDKTRLMAGDTMRNILLHPKTFGMIVSLMDRPRDYTLTIMTAITDENFLLLYKDDYILIQEDALLIQSDKHGEYLALNKYFLVRNQLPLGQLLILLKKKFPKGVAKCPALSTGHFRNMYIWMVDTLVEQKYPST